MLIFAAFALTLPLKGCKLIHMALLSPRREILLVLASFFSLCSISLGYHQKGETLIVGGSQYFLPIDMRIPLLFGIYCLYKICYSVQKKLKTQEKISAGIISVMFAVFACGGFVFEQGVPESFFTQSGIVDQIKIVLGFIGCAVFYYMIASVLFAAFNADFYKKPLPNRWRDAAPNMLKRVRDVFVAHPFWFSFVALAIVYAPIVVIYYPGMIKFDTHLQIAQGFPECRAGLPTSICEWQTDKDVFWNNHHPVIHSLLIHQFVRAGLSLFSSVNAGVFFFVCFQALILINLFAYSVFVLVKHLRCNTLTSAATLIYYMFNPIICSMVVNTTKDVLYGASLMGFLVVLFSLTSQVNKSLGARLLLSFLLGLCIVGGCFFRNDGFYVFSAFSLFLLCIPGKRVGGLALLFSVIFLHIGLTAGMKFYHVVPGSPKEMYSLPIQQTARILRTYEVSNADKEAINNVFDVELLKQRYNPTLSDPTKALYKIHATKREKQQFLMAWMRLVVQHPVTAILATWHNHYQSFYIAPGSTAMWVGSIDESHKSMDWLNSHMKSCGFFFSHSPILEKYARKFESLRRRYVLSLFLRTGLYPCALLLFLAYFLSGKKWQAIIWIFIPLCVLAFAILGPCNGYEARYITLLIFVLPLIYPIASQQSHPS